MKKNFITGFVSGAVAFGVVGAMAANMVTTPNSFPIKLNGQDVSIEGYNVDDYTYFKLRDIADDIVNNSWHIFLKHSHTYAVISKES